MIKLNLRRISEILSEKELKYVLAGCGGGTGSGSAICFDCAGFSGNPYRCTAGDCLAWASENCIYGWMQYSC